MDDVVPAEVGLLRSDGEPGRGRRDEAAADPELLEVGVIVSAGGRSGTFGSVCHHLAQAAHRAGGPAASALS
ncbi:hypothetical protein ACFQ7B_05405 [Streptomyces erythrochromogenes]|uniref:hypothetical protein n=1 Tax=Streptomyces erythrochromogenes TaxID=285574 RepID=UPI0036975C0E